MITRTASTNAAIDLSTTSTDTIRYIVGKDLGDLAKNLGSVEVPKSVWEKRGRPATIPVNISVQYDFQIEDKPVPNHEEETPDCDVCGTQTTREKNSYKCDN